ncbi:hypothetical protein [Aquimonas sp.]|uniref:hypothetical protein n=1 Tax=Aquimonas sp. TaxID=1872588 RepID=UPI0037BEA7BB
MPWALAADAVLFVHLRVVVFALLGLIAAGNLRSWRFVTAWWIRLRAACRALVDQAARTALLLLGAISPSRKP